VSGSCSVPGAGRIVWSVAFSPDDRYIASGSSASFGHEELVFWANPEQPTDPTAALSTMQITIKGEPITIPFNQGLQAWIKLYGIGSHASRNVPDYGFGTHTYAWSFHDRVLVVVGFTGKFDAATQVTFFTAKDNALTEADAADIAKNLGLKKMKSDRGTLLWTGAKFRLLCLRDLAGSNLASITIKTDQDQEVVIPGMGW
jgi:hypothetical protein